MGLCILKGWYKLQKRAVCEFTIFQEKKRQFKFLHVEVNKQKQLVIHALVHLGF